MENLEGIFPIISEHLDSNFSGGGGGGVGGTPFKNCTVDHIQRFLCNYEGKDAI